MRYQAIQADDSKWDVIDTIGDQYCAAGDSLATYDTEAEAREECASCNNDNSAGEEAHYQAQYAYACGYWD